LTTTALDFAGFGGTSPFEFGDFFGFVDFALAGLVLCGRAEDVLADLRERSRGGFAAEDLLALALVLSLDFAFA
jgi:hypothetical protein